MTFSGEVIGNSSDVLGSVLELSAKRYQTAVLSGVLHAQLYIEIV